MRLKKCISSPLDLHKNKLHQKISHTILPYRANFKSSDIWPRVHWRDQSSSSVNVYPSIPLQKNITRFWVQFYPGTIIIWTRTFDLGPNAEIQSLLYKPWPALTCSGLSLKPIGTRWRTLCQSKARGLRTDMGPCFFNGCLTSGQEPWSNVKI